MRTPFLPLLVVLALAPALSAHADSTSTAPPPAAKAPEPPPKLTVEKLGERLWRLAGVEAGGVLVLDGKDGLLIVDTQDSTTADQLDAELAKLSRHQVRYVINTHYHQDHTVGNPRFRARGAEIIAHANLAIRAAEDTTIEALGWHRKPLAASGMPTRSFTDSLQLKIDGETIVLLHPLASHTDGDCVLWFPGRNLIHTGDIVEVGAPPFIDWWGGGTIDGMIAAVDGMLARTNDQTRWVPGHGDVVNRAYVIEYRRMLVEAHDQAKDAIAKGLSLKAYGETKPLAAWAERVGGERRARRLAIQTYYGLNGFKEE